VPVECVGFDSFALSTPPRRLGPTVSPARAGAPPQGHASAPGSVGPVGNPRAPLPNEINEGVRVFPAQVATLAARLGGLAQGRSCCP